MKTLYLIRGIPGSGKSTLAKEFINFGIADYAVEADGFFVDSNGQYKFDASKLSEAHSRCKEATSYWLSKGNNVVVSNTSTTEKEVDTYKKIAEDQGAKFVSIIVESRHDGKNLHNVPDDKIEQMRKRFSIKL